MISPPRICGTDSPRTSTPATTCNNSRCTPRRPRPRHDQDHTGKLPLPSWRRRGRRLVDQRRLARNCRRTTKMIITTAEAWPETPPLPVVLAASPGETAGAAATPDSLGRPAAGNQPNRSRVDDHRWPPHPARHSPADHRARARQSLVLINIAARTGWTLVVAVGLDLQRLPQDHLPIVGPSSP
jgi:hypothetical protein